MPTPDETPGRVVVIDDDADYRQLLALCLDANGIVVTAEADDGRSGLAAVLEHAPDLIVTDLHMPNTSGLWLAEQLRALRPNLPIVMVTSSAIGGGLRDRAHAAGVDALIDKTAGPAPVASAVQMQLSRGKG